MGRNQHYSFSKIQASQAEKVQQFIPQVAPQMNGHHPPAQANNQGGRANFGEALRTKESGGGDGFNQRPTFVGRTQPQEEKPTPPAVAARPVTPEPPPLPPMNRIRGKFVS